LPTILTDHWVFQKLKENPVLKKWCGITGHNLTKLDSCFKPLKVCKGTGTNGQTNGHSFGMFWVLKSKKRNDLGWNIKVDSNRGPPLPQPPVREKHIKLVIR
jgi:hypothetical protein